MLKMSRRSSRAALLASCALALCVAVSLSASAQRQNTSQPGAQPSPQPPKKKKLPPGARGFEQFANRDASDKLITGGATRTAASDEAAASVESGTALFEQGKFPQAVEAFKRAVALKPDMFRAHFRLGMAYEAAGDYKEAAASYRRALELKPDEVADAPQDVFFAQYNLANSYALASPPQHEQAIDIYQKLIVNLPVPLAQPYYNLGLSYAAMNNQPEAEKALKKAVEIKPDYAEAHYNLGLLYSRAENYAPAAVEFKEAIKAKPDYAEARYNLGVVYYLTDNRAGLAEQQKALQDMKSRFAAALAKLK